MLEIILKNNIEVKHFSPQILQATKKALSIENPAYHKISKLTHNQFVVPREFKYYTVSKDGIVLSFPRGFISRFTGYLDRTGIEYQIEDKTIAKPLFQKRRLMPDLRECQLGAVAAAMRSEEGVIVIGTGGGKTIAALEIILQLNLTGLIVVPTNIILEQFVREAKDWFGIEIGVCNGQKKEIKEITVATWQTLASDDKSRERLIQQTGTMIVDECHGAISDDRRKTFAQFRPKYLFGLTGTARRSKDDGRTDAIAFLFGPTIYEWKAALLCPRVEMRNSMVEIPVLEYGEMIDELVAHEARNEFIATIALTHHMSSRKTLILTKRIAHFEKLQEKLGNVKTVSVSAKTKDRIEILRNLKNNPESFDILLGTSALLGTGLDVPALDTLIIAADLKSDVLTEQSIGRILRLFEGKQKPMVIDIFDKANPILFNQAKVRRKLYEELGWEITTH